ncbi:hypothetical protein BDHH15_47590 [Bradyrhizobium diazoefficiens]|uniref:Uncharacterized protein n=3 Tax=Bradyrhizobium diazoefficiens TaxID=1355477 RepID=A0A809YJV3_9BRAD|nr:hypothetical protein H12S4_50910 [Bradyrhizobium diazoefficiens]BCA21544.1 hypothetical protein BDHH15_47590 [Bradyrhizobium diazoefficiens]BCE39713.1 hypothetical protein XF3B_47440 [Bradyrhizobium diazoefficiens]BCF53109.1 hypothetical protein XF17B_47470 [Bradyrhizobium diazoefficiens]
MGKSSTPLSLRTGPSLIRRFFFAVASNFDLFGDPIPANHGGRGRPEHVPTVENRNRVNMLLAMGWSNERIAAALRVTLPTLRKHYFSELRYRAVARDRLDATLLMKAFQGVDKGRLGPFLKLVERNDLMNFGQTSRPVAAAPVEAETKPAKPAKLGKKEEALLAAHQPNTGSPMGELMARRQQGLNS